MKTSSLRKFAWVFFALALTTTTVFAQGWRKGNNVQNKQNQPCLTQISDLSEEQVLSIDKLNASHQETMAELRQQRQSTVDVIEKSEIRTKMLKQVEAHRNEVKSLLTEEQQAQYNALQSSAGYGRNQANNQQRGQGNFNRQGRGNGNAGVRGQGNGCGNRMSARGNGNGRNNRGMNQARRANCIYYNN